MNAAGECRPPERRSALSHRADGAFVHAGRRYGPSFLAVLCRGAPKQQAGGGLAVGAGHGVQLLPVRAERRCCGRHCLRNTRRFSSASGARSAFFLGGGSTLRGAFRTGAFAARLQRLSALESPGLSYVAFFPERGIRGGVSFSGIHALLPAGTDGHS